MDNEINKSLGYQMTKTQKCMYYVSNSKIKLIQISACVKNRWKLAFLTLNFVTLI